MNNKKNLFSAIICQTVTMLSGLILPRLIIGTFGSGVNGLVSSIAQFVSFISLLEGGLGAVVLSELYKPIEDNDSKKIKEILAACQCFFNKLGVVFIVYAIALAIIYPLIIDKTYGYAYTSTLVLILSFSTLVRYLFSITNSIYLQAKQKMYIVNYTLSFITICNLIIAIIIIKVVPEIHILKIMADILFLIQPLVLKHYVEKNVVVGLKVTKGNTNILKNRWSGFAQNFAHFINMNTDVAIITVFIGLTGVSIYSVYMMAINALRTIVSMLSNSYQSALGKYYASNDFKIMKKKTLLFDHINTQISMILYCTCLLLINPFVSIYTKGIADIDYYQPKFALIMVLANMFYCIREPYRYVILATGKFKETNFGAVAEAFLNIVISLFLVNKFGLLGVAIGTVIAILYRYFYFIYFLKKNILYEPLKFYVFKLLNILIICIGNIYIYSLDIVKINNAFDFILCGSVIFLTESIIVFLLSKIERKGYNILSTKHNK